MANKLKVVDKFAAVKAMLEGKPVEGFSVEQAVEFINERIAITEKKNANGGERKPTATQVANEGIKDTIKVALANVGKPATITDLQKGNSALEGFSNQKVSSLLTQLIKSGEVVRTEVKGKAHFALAEKE